jgi:hypothetical protein
MQVYAQVQTRRRSSRMDGVCLSRWRGADVSLARPYYYWSEWREATSSNSQWPIGDPYVGIAPALRANDDTYVRSVVSAQLMYSSPGTMTVYSWWATAQMRLVVSEDPQALATPSDIGDNDPLTLGYRQMNPRWYPSVAGGTNYIVVWDTGPEPLTLRTRRDFVDAGHRPQILASIFAYDFNGMFALTESGGKLIRLQITGRSLWESSVPPP